MVEEYAQVAPHVEEQLKIEEAAAIPPEPASDLNMPEEEIVRPQEVKEIKVEACAEDHKVKREEVEPDHEQ